MKKKIISYFLVVAMVFSTMPGMYMTAYGADEESVMPAAAGDVIQTVSPSSTVINVFDYQQFDDQLTGTSYIGTNQDLGMRTFIRVLSRINWVKMDILC